MDFGDRRLTLAIRDLLRRFKDVERSYRAGAAQLFPSRPGRAGVLSSKAMPLPD